VKIRDWLGISEKSQKHLTRFMQIVLAGVMAVGLFVGDPKIIVNAGMGLTVSFLPALLEKSVQFELGFRTGFVDLISRFPSCSRNCQLDWFQPIQLSVVVGSHDSQSFSISRSCCRIHHITRIG